MCGVTGVIRWDRDKAACDSFLAASGREQSHRGPDGAGVWLDQFRNGYLGVSHQRLAIIDLNHASDQPMHIPEDESVLVFNGEIYNYLELKDELRAEGVQFDTKSDTEVLGKAVSVWGIEKAVNRFNGMWAFAIYCPKKCELILCRDRMGVKPLYYFMDDSAVYFASEIKSLLSALGRKFPVNYHLVSDYLSAGVFESTDETFFAGIKKVPAATIAKIDLRKTQPNVEFSRFWRVETEAAGINEKNFIEQVRAIFEDAVKIRLRSDVPVGVLLSGGIDSSAIACAANRISAAPEELTFLSAISNGSRFDESTFINKVVQHTGRKSIQVDLQLNSSNAFNLLSKCVWHNDEPVASFSNVAHFLLMEKAREHGITVVLSGQGADEVFCGYKKYLGFYVQQMMRDGNIFEAIKVISKFVMNGTVVNQFSLAEARRYLPKFSSGQQIDVRGDLVKSFDKPYVGLSRSATVQSRQREDLERFSVPPLTHYEDRMSMAFGREIRLPFLDYRLVELAVPAPVNMKLSQGWTKYALRRSIEDICPSDVVWRKDKQGFINPESEWLRTSLKNDVEAHFSNDSMMSELGLVNAERLRSKYSNYCAQGERSGVWFKEIFAPLSLEIWLRNFGKYLA